MKAKNHSLPAILILIVLCLFVFRLYYISKTNNLVFNQIATLDNILSKKLVENFFSENNDIKKQSTKSIKKIVLKDLGYENWLNYLDFIDICLYPTDIIHDNVEDLIITVNLSQDQSVIGVYRLYEDIYTLSNKIDNLCNIKNMSTVRIGASKKSFIITEEVIDEMIGAYFVDNFVRIFLEYEGNFIEVYRQSINYSAYYYEKWSNPKLLKPKWYKIVENSVVDNITEEREYITINVAKSLLKYESLSFSSFDVPNEYKIVNQSNYDVKLVWNESYSAFIMSEGKIISKDIDVGILEDTTQTVDYLLNLTGKYYKVIDKNKRTMYVDKNDIMIVKDFSTLK